MIINVIKTGECVVLCLGIGVCTLMYVVKIKCVILCSPDDGKRLLKTCLADLIDQ